MLESSKKDLVYQSSKTATKIVKTFLIFALFLFIITASMIFCSIPEGIIKEKTLNIETIGIGHTLDANIDGQIFSTVKYEPKEWVFIVEGKNFLGITIKTKIIVPKEVYDSYNVGNCYKFNK